MCRGTVTRRLAAASAAGCRSPATLSAAACVLRELLIVRTKARRLIPASAQKTRRPSAGKTRIRQAAAPKSAQKTRSLSRCREPFAQPRIPASAQKTRRPSAGKTQIRWAPTRCPYGKTVLFYRLRYDSTARRTKQQREKKIERCLYMVNIRYPPRGLCRHDISACLCFVFARALLCESV